MTAIKYSVDVLIASGPRLTYNGTIDVDAYDRLDVVIPSGDVETIVDVQPGGAGTIKLLAIRSSIADDGVRFENDAAMVGLKSPVLLTGGAVGLLAAVPETLKFKNSLASPATVTILVGRNAVQQP